MTVDELISRLQELRAEHGGGRAVWGSEGPIMEVRVVPLRPEPIVELS